jgi:DNA polymerase IIIc chi subunit
MTKEMLKACLDNKLLMDAIETKAAIDKTRAALAEAASVLKEVGADERAVQEARDKCKEYTKIGRHYGRLIQDTWHVTWQMEAAIKKHMGKTGGELERLPRIVGL